VARIGKALEACGWRLFGYDPGESDPITDYYRAASWNGAAVFEDKYPGVIVCVQVADFTVEVRAGKNGWPVFQATPKRQGWHIEKEGQIVATGLAYLQKCSDYNHGDQYVSQVVTAIERAAERAMTASADEIAQDDDVFDTNGIRLEYDRDWTWLFFPEKPNSEVRERLKSIGARWGKTRKGWYFRQRVEREELAWLLTSAEEPHRTGEGVVHLILDDEGMDADPTGFEAGKGDAYNYIPEWMKIPPLYSTEKAQDPLAVIRLFTPDSNWSWVLSEFDGKDTCFGLVVGHETELGYVSLSEIQEVRGPLGLRIERDLWFKPRPITDLPEYKAKWGKHGGPYPGNRETGVAAKAETVVLTSFDNGRQFGYDSGRFGIWGPYTDMQGKRYTHGWTVWDNSPSNIPIPVPDPSYEGAGCENLGDWSLVEAAKQAREYFGVEIQLEGQPCWQDEYPRLSDAQELANDEAEI